MREAARNAGADGPLTGMGAAARRCSPGALLRGGVLGFARRTDTVLARWIADEVAFPGSMVDRITPAATDATRSLAEIHACTCGA